MRNVNDPAGVRDALALHPVPPTPIVLATEDLIALIRTTRTPDEAETLIAKITNRTEDPT